MLLGNIKGIQGLEGGNGSDVFTMADLGVIMSQGIDIAGGETLVDIYGYPNAYSLIEFADTIGYILPDNKSLSAYDMDFIIKSLLYKITTNLANSVSKEAFNTKLLSNKVILSQPSTSITPHEKLVVIKPLDGYTNIINLTQIKGNDYEYDAEIICNNTGGYRLLIPQYVHTYLSKNDVSYPNVGYTFENVSNNADGLVITGISRKRVFSIFNSQLNKVVVSCY